MEEPPPQLSPRDELMLVVLSVALVVLALGAAWLAYNYEGGW